MHRHAPLDNTEEKAYWSELMNAPLDKKIEQSFQTAPHFPIYMDYSATTPIDPRVADKMIPFLREQFGNPASRSHMYGWSAEAAVEEARGERGRAGRRRSARDHLDLGRDRIEQPGPEGRRQFYKTKGKHIITVKTEHKAVLDTVRELERVGFEATYLEPQDNGLITIEQLEAAIRPDTILVSVMLVNNEIGVIQPIDEIGELCRKKGIIFHCDAAPRPPARSRSTWKSAEGRPDDLHRAQDLRPERHRRPVRAPQAARAPRSADARRRPRARPAFGHAADPPDRRHGRSLPHRQGRDGRRDRAVKALRDRLAKGLMEIEEVYINGDMEHRVPHNLNVSFNFVEGESLIMAVKDLAVSSGSACTSASLEPSYVLRALGRSDELAHSSIRFTIGRFTTEEDIDFAIELLKSKVGKLRELSPLWDMFKEGIDISSIQWAAH
jgi:cysteine desulfurase